MKTDGPVSIATFARAAKVTARHVRRLVPDGLPVVDGKIPVKAGLAWLAAVRRARADDPGIQGRLGLLHVQAAGVHGRELALRRLHIHDSAWTPAWRRHVAAVRAVLHEWLETAPARVLEIFQPDGPRLFPGNDRRAIGYALEEHLVRPLLDAIDASAGDPQELPPPTLPPAPQQVAATIEDAKRVLVLARTSELALRVAVKSDVQWRRRVDVEAALATALTHAKVELMTGLPGALVRLTVGGDARQQHVRPVLAAAVNNVLAELEAPLTRRTE